VKKIFIIGDNAANRLAAKNTLDATGFYRTFVLPSADTMFQLANRFKPDLILLDVDTHAVDNFKALARVKADEKLSQIPVLFLLAKGDKESVALCVKMGAREYMARPFTEQDFLMRVDSLTNAGWVDKEVDKIVRAEHLKQMAANL
jgi:PleD family two-component response regulator